MRWVRCAEVGCRTQVPMTGASHLRYCHTHSDLRRRKRQKQKRRLRARPEVGFS